MKGENIKSNKTLTIFTPTYNRSDTLHLWYESLLRQTCKDFVWLIIDDGSNDNTVELVRDWKENNNNFEIIYKYKQNGGMHTAHNIAYEIINTELNVCIDSDDYMPNDAVEKIINFWKKNGSNKYAGIVALDIIEDGSIIGTKLPDQKQIRLCDFYANGGKGDKKLIYRSDVMRKYPPYPVFEGEKYVSLGYKYLLADQDYKLLVMNEPICIVEYLADGSTKNMYNQYLKNPKGFAFIRKIHMKYDIGLKRKFITCIHYVSSSIIIKNRNFIKETPKKILTILAMPFGFALFGLIKLKTYKGVN